MKLAPGPIETKVAASGITGGAVSLALQLLASYVPGFHAPPAATVALLVTVVTAVAAWLAPHTPRFSLAPSLSDRMRAEMARAGVVPSPGAEVVPAGLLAPRVFGQKDDPLVLSAAELQALKDKLGSVTVSPVTPPGPTAPQPEGQQ